MPAANKGFAEVMLFYALITGEKSPAEKKIIWEDWTNFIYS